ncbi:MAG: GH1 family beta-glucosidase [Candidatus Limnocylindrales bacterium]
MTRATLAYRGPSAEPDPTAFPPDFLWGAATSAYQIEGGVDEGGRGPSIWDTFAHTPGKTADGDTGDVACDHYHRWSDDLDLIAGLGLRAYRLSVSWPRLQPGGRGPLNPEGVAFYRALLEGLRDRGVRPFVTLYHWELPQALEDAGGWPMRDTAARFADFTRLTVAALGDLADDWITLNEPWCQAFLGYGSGIHAPGRRDLRAAVAAAHHLNVAHGLATQAIRAERPSAMLGIADIVADVLPASRREEDVAAAERYDANSNRLFLDPVLLGRYDERVLDLYRDHGLETLIEPGDEALVASPMDFLALNHYQRVMVSHDPQDTHLGARGVPAEPATTSLGWSVTPDAFRDVLLRVHREYPPIPLYVTENGAAFDDRVGDDGQVTDAERVDYLRGYLGAAAEAIGAGVDLRGYFAWSLMDNFEWGEGYRSRFGLVYVDYHTQERIPKASARWYRDLITRHRSSRRS